MQPPTLTLARRHLWSQRRRKEAKTSEGDSTSVSGLANLPRETPRACYVNDLHVVILSQTAAQDMAENFFAFLRKERLDKYVQDVSVRQLVVLCIFHARLSWRKGKPI
jgi:hypothetical protein